LSQTVLFELLSIAGISIGVLAYVPQVVHLVREHCSAGISGRAWTMWLTSSLLISAVALHRRDPVFIALQASSVTFSRRHSFPDPPLPRDGLRSARCHALLQAAQQQVEVDDACIRCPARERGARIAAAAVGDEETAQAV
jgi:PQ loop repeat protein